MERSGTPQSPVFCGAAAKNAQKTIEKNKCPAGFGVWRCPVLSGKILPGGFSCSSG
jgi:hypothetical protein